MIGSSIRIGWLFVAPRLTFSSPNKHTASQDRRTTRVLLPLLLVLTLFAVACGSDSGGSSGSSGSSDYALVSQIDAEVVAEELAANRLRPIDEAYRYALGAKLDPYHQHLLLAEVYARWDASNFEAIRRVFEEDLTARRKPESLVFGNYWAKVDRVNALREVMQWTANGPRTFASNEIMSVWVQNTNAEVATSRTACRATSAFVF